MKYLKKVAKEFSDFEEEIRNPGAALKKVMTEIKENGSSVKEMKKEIDEAILKDCGWTQDDLNKHFDLYSDWYKDVYHIRPDCGEYLAAIKYMIDQDKSECDYLDVSELPEDFDDDYDYDYDDYYLKDEDKDTVLDDVTLNGEPVTNQEIEKRLYDEKMQEIVDLYDARYLNEYDEYDEYEKK